jgi:myo-inositol-1(or 4)-monophosphatase
VTHLDTAISACQAAGQLLRDHFGTDLSIDTAEHHDVKLALDRESQALITDIILQAFPDHAIYGEEGIAGNQDSPLEWIVDPIDGTVNFLYGIPHFCISIALRENGEIILGTIYDPMVNELWTIEKGGKPLLNGREINASPRTKLEESIIFVGCGKTEDALATGLKRFERASLKARKMRMMGSAALGMAYIASGRLDAYIESRISLWDIAAGKLLVEAAGGKVDLTPLPGTEDAWSIVASNGKIPLHEIL